MKKSLLVLIVCALAGFFVFYGINWGVPTSEKIALTADPQVNQGQLFAGLANSRDVVYRDTRSHLDSSPFRRTDELRFREKIVIDYKKDGLTLDFSNAVRHYYLCTNDPDENGVMGAFSNIKPSKLEFNFHYWSYGGGYLYPLGAAYKVLSLAGLLKLVPDMKFYFGNVDEMGKLYTAGRAFGALVGAAGILALALFLYGLSGSVFWPSAFAALCFLSPVVITISKLLKPHFYICFFSAFVLILTHHFYRTRKMSYMFGALFLCGFVAGTIMNMVILLFLPILAYVNAAVEDKPGSRRVIKEVSLGLLAAVAGVLILNPYWFVTPAEVLSELSYVVGYNDQGFGLKPLYNFLKYGLGGYPGIVFCAALCAGLWLRKKAGGFNFVLLQFLFVAALLVSRWSPAPASMRGATFLVPLSFFYMVEMLRLVRARQLLVKAAVAAAMLFTVPGSYVFLTYCLNDSSGSGNTRVLAGEWLNANAGGASIGHISDLIPMHFPPVVFSKHRLTVYDNIGLLLADADKPEYFVYTDIEKTQFFTPRVTAELARFYRLKAEFKNKPDAFEHPYDFFEANLPVYIMEKI